MGRGWVPGPVWTGAENIAPTGISLLLFSLFTLSYLFVLIVQAFPFCLNFTIHVSSTSMPSAGFEPATPACDRPQTLALDRSATEIGGFDPRIVQPIASRYTDWDIAAHIYHLMVYNLCGWHNAIKYPMAKSSVVPTKDYNKFCGLWDRLWSTTCARKIVAYFSHCPDIGTSRLRHGKM